MITNSYLGFLRDLFTKSHFRERGDDAVSRSRLEKYLGILEVLVPKPLKFESISYRAKIECGVLRRHLDFLISHSLVEERFSNRSEATYAITDRGLAVFKTLRAREYLQKIKSILPMVEEANEIEPILSRHVGEFEEES